MTDSGNLREYFLGQGYDAFLRYHLFNDLYHPGTVQRFTELQVAPDLNVLEIGCGIGDTDCYLARNIVPKGHVTAFDAAAELVERGKQQAAELGIENITFVPASAQDFDFEPNQWDLVHTGYVLSYLSDAGEVIENAFGALKSSGIFSGRKLRRSISSTEKPLGTTTCQAGLQR